ncbi:tetratricopeptide repeat protein [Kutzneria kofuensis]|uniref:Tetratricopeptide (TPR) repeat protein n=1 Tax=Kutzneria kofuensis TaxID=103725 RepID=A0A7W9KA81_9PSEU|nr:tetratricopeptide repeat protein [Kutzneria kofuensis]MBB5888870.1 tetratricopeptide (TPR) repeat protein [Kutzneria kofuensis]
MPERPLTLQDLIRRRQAGEFVGRERQLALFEENLRLPVVDPRRRFLFSVHGAAGIGKSYLVRQFRRVATDHGFATGHVDESAYDLPSALEALAAGLGPCKEFAKRLAAYRQHRQDLDSDPTAPEGLSSLLTRSTVRAGLAAAGEVPVVGAFTKAIDARSAAEDVDKLRVFLSRKLRSHDDVQLLLSPSEVLTPALVRDLGAVDKPLALFFDTYERTSPFLDQWLRDLLAGKYGPLPPEIVFVVAGQRPLDLNLWGDYLSVRTDLPLEVFTEAEAGRFLASRGVTDDRVVDVILGLSGRLPVLVAMLAESQPTDVAEVGDPSGSAVERFLKWEPDPQRRTAALFGALPRRFSAEVFAVAAGSVDHLPWLLQQPFVTEQADGFHYHDVVRSQMLRVLQRRSPAEWRSRHLALAEHNHDSALERAYHRLCADRAAALPEALQDLITAFSVRRSLAPQWARMIVQAGRETDAPDVVRRGTELVEAADHMALIGLLVDDRSLPAEARALAHSERGVLLRAARDFDPALADFQAAVDLDPDNICYVGDRGETLRRMGRAAEAIEDLDRLLAVDPGNGWAYGCRGAAFQALGRLEESLGDLDKAIELRPRYTWAFGARAETLRRMGRLPEALADVDRAIELDRDYIYGMMRRADILLMMNEPDRAAADLERVVELNGHRSHAFFLLALISRSHTLILAALATSAAPMDRAVCLWALGRQEESIAEIHAALAEGTPPSLLVSEFQLLHETTGQGVEPVLAILE